MPKALRFLGWPVLVGVLLALLIIQRNPSWSACHARRCTSSRRLCSAACRKARCPMPMR